MIHPCFLLLLKRFTSWIEDKYLLNTVVFVCGVLTISLIFGTSSLVIGALESYVLTMHPAFLVVFIAMLTLNAALSCALFWHDLPFHTRSQLTSVQ